MDVDKLIAVIGVIIAILGVVDSGLQRYVRANTGKYAAQRDFEHLRRNQEQLKESLRVVIEDSDKMNDEMIRLSVQISTLLAMKESKLREYNDERNEEC